jgi:hypothetical protein
MRRGGKERTKQAVKGMCVPHSTVRGGAGSKTGRSVTAARHEASRTRTGSNADGGIRKKSPTPRRRRPGGRLNVRGASPGKQKGGGRQHVGVASGTGRHSGGCGCAKDNGSVGGRGGLPQSGWWDSAGLSAAKLLVGCFGPSGKNDSQPPPPGMAAFMKAKNR